MTVHPIPRGGAVLLDTNALLWLLTDDPRLGRRSVSLLSSGVRVLYSSVSILEVTIKEMLGRLALPGDPLDAAEAAGLDELPFTSTHAGLLRAFPDLVRHDPFDRMLLAQSRAEGIALLTADSVLLGLGEHAVLDARD